MKLEVAGYVSPKVWEMAKEVKKKREKKRFVNAGGGISWANIYEVILPKETKKEDRFLVTPEGIRLYHFPGSPYEVAHLVSELDEDEFAKRYFRT